MSRPVHKVGEFYFYAFYDDEEGKVQFFEYGLRSIRKGVAHFTLKMNKVTWGKVSKRHGDFGWLPNVPKWTRDSIIISSDQMLRYRSSKQAAITAALAAARRDKKLPMFEDDGDPETEIEALQKAWKRYSA